LIFWNQTKFKTIKLNSIINLSCILIILYEIRYLSNEVVITTNFRTAYDLRVSKIKKAIGSRKNADLYLDKLPPSGILGIAELSTKKELESKKINSAFDLSENYRYKLYYNLPFEVYLSESKATPP
jgi:hypothetical protein